MNSTHQDLKLKELFLGEEVEEDLEGREGKKQGEEEKP